MTDVRPSEFTAAVCMALVDGLRWAYREALDLKGDSLGLDEQWYGLTVYKLIGPQLGVRLAPVSDATVIPLGVTYEIFLGRQHLRYNKLRGPQGSSPYAYPRPSRAAQRMADLNQAQMELQLEGLDQPLKMRLLGGIDEQTPTEWILGHTGSSTEGLTGAYLCAPAIAVDGEITAWRTWIPIYYAGSAMPATGSIPAPGLPEPAEIAEPVVRIKSTPARKPSGTP